MTVLQALGLLLLAALIDAGHATYRVLRRRARTRYRQDLQQHVEALLGAGNYRQAEAEVERAEQRARKKKDPDLHWLADILRAAARLEAGRLDRASVHLTEAAQIARDHLTPYHVAVALGELAWIEFFQGDNQTSGILLAWAARLTRGTDSRNLFAARSLLLAALLSSERSDLEGAEQALRSAVEILKQLEDLELLELADLEGVRLAYLQTWYDSAMAQLDAIAPRLEKRQRRGASLRLLQMLSELAEATGRPGDRDHVDGLIAALKGQRSAPALQPSPSRS